MVFHHEKVPIKDQICCGEKDFIKLLAFHFRAKARFFFSLLRISKSGKIKIELNHSRQSGRQAVKRVKEIEK